MMRKKKRSDPSVLTAAIREAAERQDRASKRVEEQLAALQQRMRDSDPPEDEDTVVVDVEEDR
jgi:DNA-binding NarL/FixJ family response regulator